MGFWQFLGILGAVLITVVWLYHKGFVVIKTIVAVMFVFLRRKGCDRAEVVSCSGRVRYAGRFRESRIYEFAFDSRLSKGEAEVMLLDGKKQEIVKLGSDSAVGRAEINRKNRYYLRWEFKNASGQCELRWH